MERAQVLGADGPNDRMDRTARMTPCRDRRVHRVHVVNLVQQSANRSERSDQRLPHKMTTVSPLHTLLIKDFLTSRPFRRLSSIPRRFPSMARRLFSSIEPLESRIAPAALVGVNNPLPDLIAGLGKTSSVIDLGHMFAAQDSSAYHSIVQFTTNFDMDPVKAGLQPGVIQIELYDDVAPL